MVEREELRNELKLKEAKYFVAKAEYDKLDKEYKEYVEKHKQLEEQAKSIQEQVLSVLGFTGTRVQILTLLLLQPDPDSGKAEA
jgi:chromosome segregation ATPase